MPSETDVAEYMMKLPTDSQRLRVLFDWTVEPFFERDVSELGVEDTGGQGATA